MLQNDELGTSNLVLTQSKTLSRPDVLTKLPKTKVQLSRPDVLTNLPKIKVQLSRPDVLTNLQKSKVHWVSDFFDLMWPKQSQIKSYSNYLSGIQKGFCSFFVQYLPNLSPMSC